MQLPTDQVINCHITHITHNLISTVVKTTAVINVKVLLTTCNKRLNPRVYEMAAVQPYRAAVTVAATVSVRTSRHQFPT